MNFGHFAILLVEEQATFLMSHVSVIKLLTRDLILLHFTYVLSHALRCTIISLSRIQWNKWRLLCGTKYFISCCDVFTFSNFFKNFIWRRARSCWVPKECGLEEISILVSRFMMIFIIILHDKFRFLTFFNTFYCISRKFSCYRADIISDNTKRRARTIPAVLNA